MPDNPHMYYWTKDEADREWRILLVGEYESYPDGNNIVADLYVAEYYYNGKTYSEELVPDEISGFADSLLDDKDTYLDIQREYESEGQHLL
jgi:hypothetical protein